MIIDQLDDLSNGKLIVIESNLPLTDSSEFLKNKLKTNNFKSGKNRKKNKRRF